MERIIDITCLLAMCLISAVAGSAAPLGMPSPALVACFLAATTSALLCEWARGRAGVLGLVAYCALATLRPEGLLFLPAATYGSSGSHSSPCPGAPRPSPPRLPGLRRALHGGFPCPHSCSPRS